MTPHHYRLPVFSGRSSGSGRVGSTLAALALGLAAAGAAHAANLSPLARPGAPGLVTGRPIAHVPPPRIAVASVTTAFQHNCNGPQPIFVASVKLHNSGGALAAQQGLVSVSDTNPQIYQGRSLRLVSAGIEMPAIGAYSDAVVPVPVSSLASYAGEVGVKHLTVRVLPTFSAGKYAFRQPSFYSFSVTVPQGFCARGPSVPRAATGRVSIPLRGRPLR